MGPRVLVFLVIIFTTTRNATGRQVNCGNHYVGDSCQYCNIVEHEYEDGSIGYEYKDGSWCNGECTWFSDEEICGRQVNCGNHYTYDYCSNCVYVDGEFRGGTWCNGDCTWLWDEEECVPTRTANKPNGKLTRLNSLAQYISSSYYVSAVWLW